MRADYDVEDLPPETVVENGREWEREKFDDDAYQWVRPMDEDEYDWDADDVSIVGRDVPVRVVSVQFTGGKWFVEGAQTMGPDHSRPGFTEAISDEFFGSFDDAEAAFDAARECIESLS